jgi:NADP-dependent 3-hydroxy acid dehydrogenase YdfG
MTHQKVALVTGAGTGIGKASALALLNSGYQVIFVGRRQDVLEAAIAQAGSLANQAQAIATLQTSLVSFVTIPSGAGGSGYEFAPIVNVATSDTWAAMTPKANVAKIMKGVIGVLPTLTATRQLPSAQSFIKRFLSQKSTQYVRCEI